MESTTARKQHAMHPMSYYIDMVKDMDDSQKLELVSVIIDSMKPKVAAQSSNRYTMDEINAMLDEAEAEIAAGKGIPDEELWSKYDEEFALEEQAANVK